jgi:hypothetical protein
MVRAGFPTILGVGVVSASPVFFQLLGFKKKIPQKCVVTIKK